MLDNDSVLYYPSIEIQNIAWLKTSLFVWDNIYRIVPRNYSPKDSDMIMLCVENDLIRPIYLESEDLKSVSSEYLNFLEESPFTPAGLDNRFVDKLHKDKIDSRLYPVIEKLAGDCDPDGFYHVRQDLARGYMFYLADSVAKRRNLTMVTDNRDAWSVMPYFIESANFSEQVWNPDAEGYYSSLIFTDILPANIEHVDIKEIIDFVGKRKDERVRLRSVLNSFSEQVSRCSSLEHAITLRRDFQKEISQAKNDFKKSCGFVNDDLGYSLLVVGLPVGLSLFSAIGMQGDPYTPTNILSSVFIGAIAAYLDYQRVKEKNRDNSYVSYLVDIDQKLAKQHKMPLYWRSFEEFFND